MTTNETAAAGQQAAGQQQLQRGHSVWLAPERFESADFSPDQCVAELRRYVSAQGSICVCVWCLASLGAGSTTTTAGTTLLVARLCCVLWMQVPLPTVKAELQTHLVRLKNKVRGNLSLSAKQKAASLLPAHPSAGQLHKSCIVGRGTQHTGSSSGPLRGMQCLQLWLCPCAPSSC